MPDLLTFLALVAFVLVLAGLTEGFVAKAPMSFPIVFLGLGVVLGFRGVISLTPHSPLLEAVAVVTLSLVLFLDAVRMKLDRSSSEWLVPSLVLGPGTLLTLLIDPYQFAAGVFGGGPNYGIDNSGFARTLMFAFTFVAVGAYTAVVWSMYRSMVKNFDMTIRRQSR